MLRGRGHARPILDDSELDEAVRAVEVRPAIVVAQHARAAVGGQHLAPALELRLHAREELAAIGLEARGDEALCDDWFWKDRLPCWNWGYGG